MSVSTDHFYAELPALQQFADLVNPANYQDAPKDWYALVTDIHGSTRAIEEGRYKDVNLLGASSIIAVLNAIGHLDIPFVFGGDGASLLVPPHCLPAGRKALLGVRRLAATAFGLDLRVGAVPVETIQAQSQLKVAKFSLTPTYDQASFMGGGITYATDLLKTNPLYQFEETEDSRRGDLGVNLTGLECRWREIPSPQGQTLSIIVAATTLPHPDRSLTKYQVYQIFLDKIKEIYGTPEQYNPITPQALQLTLNPRKLWAEVKARSQSSSLRSRLQYWVQVTFETLLGIVLMALKLEDGGVNWGNYKEEVCFASDYQKIDDVLRMIIASNPDRTAQLIQALDEYSQAGLLTYGLHVSDRALLTCLIFEGRDRHLHLVDGADGGYALAAKALKAQLHRRAKNWHSYRNLLQYRQQLEE
ncbi:MAG: DUF3095 domain-containing protein [Prochlorothrix sp.]